MDSSNEFNIKTQLDKILSNLKVNDIYYCGITNAYYIIKKASDVNNIKTVMINNIMVYIIVIPIDRFISLKKVDFIPNNIINRFKRYGIHIDN